MKHESNGVPSQRNVEFVESIAHRRMSDYDLYLAVLNPDEYRKAEFSSRSTTVRAIKEPQEIMCIGAHRFLTRYPLIGCDQCGLIHLHHHMPQPCDMRSMIVAAFAFFG